MKAICIDDERLVLEEMKETLVRTGLFDDVFLFSKSKEGMDFIKNNTVDIAFLDINMSEIDGISLAKEIKLSYPKIHIVFVTGYSEYSLEAFRVHASGYLLKPVTETAIREQVEYMKSYLPIVSEKKFRAHTFGNFEFYVNDEPVHFSCAKAKELLAYVIDRKGAAVTIGEAAGVLFEDRRNEMSAKAGVRNAYSNLNKTLRNVGADCILNKQRATLSLNTPLIDCDFYSLLNGDAAALNAYTGEYMSQYSWAEVTLAGIEDQI